MGPKSYKNVEIGSVNHANSLAMTQFNKVNTILHPGLYRKYRYLVISIKQGLEGVSGLKV